MTNGNHLVNEKSPYLQAHAHNPVNWFPWGEEAFSKAKEEDKPVFLSSGYSTCHWCHVMEKESFSDSEIGELLNDAFVCVKVDREERPDIDALYMAVCQLMNGHGGWPLNVMLTPEGLPFFAGTYFPRDTVGNFPGLTELVPRVKFLWETQRDSLLKAAADLSGSLERNSFLQSGELPGERTMDRAYRRLEKNFDSQWGGFYGAPKFPMPSVLLFLASYSRYRGISKALEMSEFTLKKMGMGGIMDHLGGGFHRYSTDRYWKVPHFEKMLYDQALILSAAAEVYRETAEDEILWIAEMTASCILDTMASPEGAFFSAMDADSEEGEGRYYLWTVEELRKVVGPDWELFTTLFDVRDEGNFQEESTGTKNGLNILYMKQTTEEAAEAAGINKEKFEEYVATWRSALLEERNGRKAPFMDEKILTDWNSHAISALLEAGKVMDRPGWIEAACKTSGWIHKNMISSEGVLFHRHFQGDTAIEGFLDDYAFYADALIRIYRIRGGESALNLAQDLVDKMIDLFYDHQNGGFFFADTGKDLFFRLKDAYDGASLSGNAAAMNVLLDIASITGRDDYREKALATAKTFSGRIEEIPSSHTYMLRILMQIK